MGRAERRAFQELAAAGGDRASAQAAALAFRARGEATNLEALAALLVAGAASAPERLVDLYDGVTAGWTGRAPSAPAFEIAAPPPARIPTAFWAAFWALVDETPGALGAGGVTERTASLLGELAPELGERVGEAALAYPGVAAAVAQGYPARFTLEALARCPRGSLGGEFHELIVENGFDLEVLDRETLGLEALPAPHSYLNARILQCHDLWHLAAGYRTTALHEVAISAFQAAQFGHHYSAMFLAMVLTRVAFDRPEGAGVLLDVVASAWTHGRESPPILGIRWEALWDQPVEAVRRKIKLSAYQSPYPADLFEQLSAAR